MKLISSKLSYLSVSKRITAFLPTVFVYYTTNIATSDKLKDGDIILVYYSAK